MFGYHRVGLIRDRENFYLIDAANTVVYVMTEDEFHCGIIINNITNLSVLFSIEDKNFLGGTDGFETKTFQHLM
jgi:hypothetical protein